MLPSNLLRARVSIGKLRPKYVLPEDQNALTLSESLINSYECSVGGKKGVLLQKLKNLESQEPDYKLFRGLVTLLERRCTYAVESPVDPKYARDLVFKEASRKKVVASSERSQVIQDVSERLSLEPADLENSLWKDLEEEQVLKDFLPINPGSLIRRYNFSLAQTALFKSTKMEFTSSGNWKNIFRDLKRLGLMYLVENKEDEGGEEERENASERYVVSLDGPLSLFKMTDRYGTSFAKLLNQLIESDSWRFKAELFDRMRNRLLYFEETSTNVTGLFEAHWDESSNDRQTTTVQLKRFHLYDSRVEEKFARTFNALNTGWVLRREPEPLIVGRHVLIPDFSFEKEGSKAYLEIVGFWTKEYLERKLAKLSSLPPTVDMMVAADESLAAASAKKFERMGRSNLLFFSYSKEVPVDPILKHLRKVEEAVVQKQVETLRKQSFQLHGEIVSMKSLAESSQVSIESVQEIFSSRELGDYRRIGDYLVSLSKVAKLKRELQALGQDLSLSEAVKVIETEGLQNPQQVLTALGYTIEWEGLDYDKSRVKPVH